MSKKIVCRIVKPGSQYLNNLIVSISDVSEGPQGGGGSPETHPEDAKQFVYLPWIKEGLPANPSTIDPLSVEEVDFSEDSSLPNGHAVIHAIVPKGYSPKIKDIESFLQFTGGADSLHIYKKVYKDESKTEVLRYSLIDHESVNMSPSSSSVERVYWCNEPDDTSLRNRQERIENINKPYITYVKR